MRVLLLLFLSSFVHVLNVNAADPIHVLVWDERQPRQIGQGKVFDFRPGHEEFPVFKQAEMIQILSNACHWLGEK